MNCEKNGRRGKKRATDHEEKRDKRNIIEERENRGKKTA